MTTLAGDLPRYEEALRALYSGNADHVRDIASHWPDDIGNHVLSLLQAFSRMHTSQA